MPEVSPEFLAKVLGLALGERDVVPAVIGWQIERVAMIGGHHRAEAVKDVVLTQVFLVDPQRIRRRRQHGFGVVVEPVTVDAPLLTHVARLAYPHYDPAQELVVLADEPGQRDIAKIPRSDRRDDGL